MAKRRKMTTDNLTESELAAALSAAAPLAAKTILQAYPPVPGTDYDDQKITLVINYLSEAKYKDLSAHNALCADQLYLTDAI